MDEVKERSVTRMEELEAMEADGRMAVLPKKEQIKLRKELGKLQANLNGIRNMRRVPDAIFVIDTTREEIAIKEAKRLGIPVVGTLDTNCDPDDVDYGISLDIQIQHDVFGERVLHPFRSGKRGRNAGTSEHP